jgi:hypothetical protein
MKIGRGDKDKDREGGQMIKKGGGGGGGSTPTPDPQINHACAPPDFTSRGHRTQATLRCSES